MASSLSLLRNVLLCQRGATSRSLFPTPHGSSGGWRAPTGQQLVSRSFGQVAENRKKKSAFRHEEESIPGEREHNRNRNRNHSEADVESESELEKENTRRRIQEMRSAGFGDLDRYLDRREVNSSILLDQFNRQHTYLRISLTERCNLRCTYCMPAEGVPLSPASHLMSTEEIGKAARLFVQAGIRKIRLTGGEPTLRRDVVDVVAMLNELKKGKGDDFTGTRTGTGTGTGTGLDQIGMTSNGMILHRMLPDLKRAGLTHLNISLDTLRHDRFEHMTRRPGKGLDKVRRCIDMALDQDFAQVKVNVVVMKGQNEDEVLDFVELTRHMPLNVRFIEWMPFDGNVWSVEKMEPYQVTRQKIEDHFGPLTRVRERGAAGYDKHAVAKDFQVEGFQGEVAFITSMTEHFCGSCSRLRLMADGNFKVCLFGSEETNLVKPMRKGCTEEELAGMIYHAVQRKKAKHAGMFELSKMPNRHMVRIGG